MKNKRSALPNFFTLTNVFLGFLAILYIADHRFSTAAWLIIIATFCDLIDGKLARWSRTYSRFGKELDSIADAISFGVAPGFLVYATNFSTVGMWGAFFCFMYVLAGIFRLARFNIDTTGYKKKSYKGLPIPVAALSISSFFIMAQYFWDTVQSVHVVLVLVPVLSLLMVSTIKFETIPSLVLGRNILNNFKLFLWIASIVCIIINPRIWFFPWSMIYIVFSVAEGIVDKLRMEDEEAEITVDKEQNIQ